MEYNKQTKIIYGGDFEKPIPDISFGELLYTNLLKGNNDIALISAETGRYLTYKEVLRRSIIIANTLKNLNIRQNDSVGIFSENHINFPISIIAPMFLGVKVAPINFSYRRDELIHCLSITKPNIVFCSPTTLSRLLEIKNKCKFIQKLIVFDMDIDTDPLNNINNEFVYSYKSLMREYDNHQLINIKHFDVAKTQKTDVTIVFCSSGTTGLPKGVALTNRNLVVCYNVTTDTAGFNFQPTDVHLLFLPLFHAYGCTISLFNLILNAKQVIMQKFVEQLFLSLIPKYQISVLVLVPPICVILTKSDLVMNYDLSSVRAVISGAAPLSGELSEAVVKRIPNIPTIFQGYGMTETTLGVLLSLTDSLPGSVGQVIPGMYCKVVDPETRKVCGPNEKGELCFKGEMIMKGYYENPEATRNTIDSEGWLHTGDIGYYDDKLRFYIVDRLKELIKYNGFQVPPAELEALLLENEHVNDVGVIGIPDERAGELPLAFIVRQPNSKITKKEIINYVKERVSPQKHLHGGVIFVDEIPKNPSGKILRRQLREVAKRKSNL